MSFQNCHIAAIGEKNRQVCQHLSVVKIASDFRWLSNSPRSAYKIARCVAGLRDLDNETKVKMKQYADKKYHAEETIIVTGDKVLLEQQRVNELTTPFENQPYEVIRKHGNGVLIESPEENQEHFV